MRYGQFMKSPYLIHQTWKWRRHLSMYAHPYLSNIYFPQFMVWIPKMWCKLYRQNRSTTLYSLLIIQVNQDFAISKKLFHINTIFLYFAFLHWSLVEKFSLGIICKRFYELRNHISVVGNPSIDSIHEHPDYGYLK